MSDLKILHTESGQQVVDYDYAKNLIEQQQTRIDELAATVERLNKEANALYDLAQDAGVCSEYLRVNFASGHPTPTNSLAERDAEVARKAYEQGYQDCFYSNGPGVSLVNPVAESKDKAKDYANTKYPIDKDGE